MEDEKLLKAATYEVVNNSVQRKREIIACPWAQNALNALNSKDRLGVTAADHVPVQTL